MLAIHSPSPSVDSKSPGLIQGSAESAESVDLAQGTDEPDVLLAPKEIATLTSLMRRYEELLLEMDHLNDSLEELLNAECPPKNK